MLNGTYRTANGSSVTVEGKHGGCITIDFDWLEEGAFVEAIPEVDRDTQELRWTCPDGCGCDGSTQLNLITTFN